MIFSNILSSATSLSTQGSEKLPEIAKTLAPFVQDTLKWFRNQYEVALYVATFLVGIGVILEGFEVVHEHREKTGPFKIHRPESPKWMTRAAFWGWLLVSVGVAGEFIFEGWVSTKNEELESVSSALLGDAEISAAEANQEAGEARVRAVKDEKDLAELKQATLPRTFDMDRVASKLKNFSGVAANIYSLTDLEPSHTANMIRETIKRAEWADNGGGSGGMADAYSQPGVWIEVAPINDNDFRLGPFVGIQADGTTGKTTKVLSQPVRKYMTTTERFKARMKLDSAAKALVEALNSEGVQTGIRPLTNWPMMGGTTGSLHVFVSLRPMPGMPDLRVFSAPSKQQTKTKK